MRHNLFFHIFSYLCVCICFLDLFLITCHLYLQMYFLTCFLFTYCFCRYSFLFLFCIFCVLISQLPPFFFHLFLLFPFLSLRHSFFFFFFSRLSWVTYSLIFYFLFLIFSLPVVFTCISDHSYLCSFYLLFLQVLLMTPNLLFHVFSHLYVCICFLYFYFLSPPPSDRFSSLCSFYLLALQVFRISHNLFSHIFLPVLLYLCLPVILVSSNVWQPFSLRWYSFPCVSNQSQSPFSYFFPTGMIATPVFLIRYISLS